MSLRLAGLGWVTPLGSTIDGVWAKLLAGIEAEAATLGESLGEKSCRAFPVPLEAISEAARHPRLRRSSAISRFAVVAGLSALRDAKLELSEASGTGLR
jgi:3-oxoacyl-(acyl-carrier-protein) synthase